MPQLTNFNDRLKVFFAFDPTSPRPVNWVYAFSLWGLLLIAGACVFELKSSYLKAYPPTTWTNALILDTPLITDLVWLLAVAVFATGIGRFRFNSTIRWTAAEPVTLKWRGRAAQVRWPVVLIVAGGAGFALYLLQKHLVAYTGGPVTRSQEALGISPVVASAFAVTAVFCAPLAEELFYRGVLFIQAHGQSGRWRRL